MKSKATVFQKEATIKSFDIKHRNTIKFNMARYKAAFEKGFSRYKNPLLARERATYIKRTALNMLPDLLLEFERNIQKRGVKVFWAETAAEANNYILNLFLEKKVKHVVKSKSMTTEELEINHYLEHNEIEVVETDLGEYIVQIAGEKPYHIVTPAMHKSKEDVAQLFHEKFNTPINSTPSQITAFVRKKLREKYLAANAAITGANFLIADSGSISLTENEGNGFLSMSFPKIHVVVAGIEKIIPSLRHLPFMLPWLAVHGTGQNITVYNSIVSASKQANEIDGPNEMHIVLLDNGRSDLYGKKPQNEALACIRCGACLNNCPVYKNIGGYTYAATYSGPIGSVITPFYNGFKTYQHLSFASSLCGKCTEICPVNIPLHKLLLYNRKEAVEAKYSPVMERIAMKTFGVVMQNRTLLDFSGHGIKNFAMSFINKRLWGKHRSKIIFKKPFSSNSSAHLE